MTKNLLVLRRNWIANVYGRAYHAPLNPCVQVIVFRSLNGEYRAQFEIQSTLDSAEVLHRVDWPRRNAEKYEAKGSFPTGQADWSISVQSDQLLFEIVLNHHKWKFRADADIIALSSLAELLIETEGSWSESVEVPGA